MKQAIYPLIAFLLFIAATEPNKEKPTVQLPTPGMSGGMPLMAALKNRQSSRAFSDKDLTAQQLSDLLWAARGINRPQSGMRTAPTAMNQQEMDVYVAKKDGVFRYDAKGNCLHAIDTTDIRSLTGGQDFVKTAAVNLVFVADCRRSNSRVPEADRRLFAYAHAGFISENVYLFCASEGLCTVVRWAPESRNRTATALGLSKEQEIILFQSVGNCGAK
jgi:nitroreductase